MSRLWHIRCGRIDEWVHADDQLAAWETLRERPIEDFGLVASAEPDENEDETVFIRTPALLFWWEREEDARRFVALAVEQGLPDTTELDRDFGAERRASG